MKSVFMDISMKEKIYSAKQFFTALGLPLRGHWRTRKPKLMGHLHQYGTECLIVDDAHDLSLEHLMLIKEVTDQGRLQYDHPPGFCFAAAWPGKTLPFREASDPPLSPRLPPTRPPHAPQPLFPLDT